MSDKWYEYKFYLSIGYSNANVEEEVDIRSYFGDNQEKWEKLDKEEQADFLRKLADDIATNYLEISIEKT